MLPNTKFKELVFMVVIVYELQYLLIAKMKIPSSPPDFAKVLDELSASDLDKARRLITSFKATDSKGRYLHWDKLQHHEPPKGLTSAEWWTGIKFARIKTYKQISLLDKSNSQFVFSTPDFILENLHWLDKNATGNISGDIGVANPQMRNTYIIRSLINESIDSSQLEGAITTRKVAKEMLLTGRKPHDKSEQMIFNNYLTMQFIRENKNEKLTPAFILELHKILTDKTLENLTDAGAYRSTGDDIQIVDARDNTELHTPPNANELPKRMELLCRFANNESSKYFIHPILRAILLHFMLGYDHPFVDGNGRTARALFYWSALNSGYWLMEFISISHIIKQAPAQYGKAFLHTETDDNDTTYFIIHQINVIKKAIKALQEYIEKKAQEIKSAEKMLESTHRLRGDLNFRQKTLLRHALKHPGHVYKINEHQHTHDIAYDTARTDLLFMSDKLNFLIKHKKGRVFIFESPHDLQRKIEDTKGF